MGKLRNSESRLEDDKKNLRIALEDAENRCTKLELARRSAEGELQRFKLAMNDKDTENQVCFIAIICCIFLTNTVKPVIKDEAILVIKTGDF